MALHSNGFGLQHAGRPGLSRWGSAALVLIALALAIAGPATYTPAVDVASAQSGSGDSTSIEIEGWVASSTEAGAEARDLVVATVDGRFEVAVDAAAEVQGDAESAGDLAAGQRVMIRGDVRADATVEAELVDVEAPPAPAPPDAPDTTVHGRVLANVQMAAGAGSGDERLIIVATHRTELTAQVDSGSVLVDASGNAITAAELEVGDAIELEGRGEATGTVRIEADRVSVLPPGRPTRVHVEGVLKARAGVRGGGGDERWIVGRVALDVSADVAASVTADVGTTVAIDAERGDDGELDGLAVSVIATVTETVELRGEVEAVGDGTVRIEGIELSIDGDTDVEGNLEVGSFAAVTAEVRTDGSLRADAIDVIEIGPVRVEFEGEIEAVGALEWTVDGTTVQLDLLSTVVTGLAAAPGLHAEVSGTLRADGTVEADRIHVQSDILGGLRVLDGRLVAAGDVPGTWQISVMEAGGAEVTLDIEVTSETVIDESGGAAEAGALVQVRAEIQGDGSLRADVIRVLSPGDSS